MPKSVLEKTLLHGVINANLLQRCPNTIFCSIIISGSRVSHGKFFIWPTQQSATGVRKQVRNSSPLGSWEHRNDVN